MLPADLVRVAYALSGTKCFKNGCHGTFIVTRKGDKEGNTVTVSCIVCKTVWVTLKEVYKRK